MGEEADADWQAGLVEWGIEDAKKAYRSGLECKFCDGNGFYDDPRMPCTMCRGTGLAMRRRSRS